MANRQTGSAFKVFALMDLIHDEQGNPNETYYTSKPLAAGWLPADPNLVGAHRRGHLQRHDQHHQRDVAVGQHRVRAAVGRHGQHRAWRQARSDGPCDGHHLEAHRQRLGGARRAQVRHDAAADGRRVRDDLRRRRPTTPRRSSPRSPPPVARRSTSATPRARASSPTPRAMPPIRCSRRSSPTPGRPPTARATAARRPAKTGTRQQPRQRVVRRLLPQGLHRGVGRQPDGGTASR